MQLSPLIHIYMIHRFLCLLAVLTVLSSCKDNNNDSIDLKKYEGWRTYAGTKDAMRYSSNDQINLNNVSRLQLAWTYSSNDKDTGNRSQNQCNPVMVDGILYGTTPRLKLFALNAATGEQKWLFDPASEDSTAKKDPFVYFKVSRGVTYWQNESGNEKRIFYSVASRTYAINVADGKPVRSFGKGGYIDLVENLDTETANFDPFVVGTTPGIVYRDLLIMGTRLGEAADAAPGHIRAYDVRTGKRRWIFHTIPHPGEKGYETWPDKDAWKKLGGANNWAGMSLDEKRGILYVPTGSIGGDFYGGIRKGQNLFANSLIALEAATGKYLWHFQFVHHDLWDRDLPATPNLVTLHKDGKIIDAVAQITKNGYIFLFDRITGKPVFTIEERAVPTTDALPGEEPWPTQPIPSLPEPFARQRFDSNDVTDISAEARNEMMERYRKVKYNTPFTPPSKEGSWIFPGYDGGGEWGGAAVDPESGILYVNSSEMPWAMVMMDVPKKNDNDRSLKGRGRMIYNRYCITCHGPELKGNGSSYPSLVNLNTRSTEEQVRKLIEYGRNMMPAFKQITESEKAALVSFLLDLEEKKNGKNDLALPKEPGGGEADHLPAMKSILDEVPYTMTGYNRFLDKNGYPGIKPPWGTLNAVDLVSGKLLWKVPLGEYPELTKKGIPPTGTECYGGPLVTKGGLVFIAASKDSKIRAFDKRNGKIVWEANLPVPGFATPASYTIDGRQYVVIACGGGKIGSKSGDEYLAFALSNE
jgi:quinoprotein glucose dehydrogenase